MLQSKECSVTELKVENSEKNWEVNGQYSFIEVNIEVAIDD